MGRTHDHKTILELKKQFPEFSFTMIVGLDAMMNFEYWEKPKIFCQNADFAIAPRPPFSEMDFFALKSNLVKLGFELKYAFIDFPMSNTSSSWIRDQLQDNDIVADIHPDVHSYIVDQRLYINS